MKNKLNLHKTLCFILLMVFLGCQSSTVYSTAEILEKSSLVNNKFQCLNNESLDCFDRLKHKIISAPTDLRPISNEYLENLINFGGDQYIGPSKEYLDKGPSSSTKGDWIQGDSFNLRKDILNKVKDNNNFSTSVIINTSAYFFGGLVGTRLPSSYFDDSIDKGLNDLDEMTLNYSLPRYYVHLTMPRVIPETRGFDYQAGHMGNGLCYYYNLAKNLDPEKTSFSSMLIEYGYVKTKKDNGNNLEIWEANFLNNFIDTYITNATPEFKYREIPIASLYEKIFAYNGELLKSLIDRIKKGSIDEIAVSMDDYVIPDFIHFKRNEEWVNKDENGNILKFSFNKKYIDLAMKYQEQLFNEKSVADSIKGLNKKINYIYGTDELPQMIYARDLTYRKGLKTNFQVEYKYDPDPERSKKHVGYFEATSTEKLIDQRINYVTRKTSNEKDLGTLRAPKARKFVLFVHNSDIRGGDGENCFLTEEQSKTFAQAVYDSYNQGNNVGVLDLATNIVDWNLFKALTENENNNINQLACYSGWNTIGNSTGLGIAHAQVFGLIDILGDFAKDYKNKAKYQSKILAQHLIEDGIYNTKIKSQQPNNYDYIKKEINNILNSQLIYDENNKPGGYYWVMNKFTKFPMRLNNQKYLWSTTLLRADLPLNRTFECIVKCEFD